MSEKVRDGALSGLLRTLRFREVVPHIKGRRILDIGCDQGYIIPHLPDDIEYIGIDQDEHMLGKARIKYPDHIFYKIEINADTVGTVELGTFDTILMVAVIEHMDQPFEILTGLSSFLNVNGRIIITSPAEKGHGLLSGLSCLGLTRNDKDEHESYIDNAMMSGFIAESSLEGILHKTFEFGLNQLWVLKKNN